MTSRTTEELLDFLSDKRKGDVFEIATSQYADNTTPPGHKFDHYSTAQAVRGLIKRGIIKGECRWRYFEVEVL